MHGGGHQYARFPNAADHWTCKVGKFIYQEFIYSLFFLAYTIQQDGIFFLARNINAICQDYTSKGIPFP